MVALPELKKPMPTNRFKDQESENIVFDCGWGRLIFGNTFDDPEQLVDALRNEQRGKRNIVIYSSEPHVALSIAPQEVFLDPSHHFRLLKENYKPGPKRREGFCIRSFDARRDIDRMNQIYQSRDMVLVDPSYLREMENQGKMSLFVAEDTKTGKILGVITCLDHEKIYRDKQKGVSLWALAVDPQAIQPGIGELLLRHSAEHFFRAGREFIDLSVLHDNDQAIGLYQKLGFHKVSFFFIKHKSAINEKLYTGLIPENLLNPYAMIIINEARRRGIATEILDDELNLFSLSFGGRTIRCRESLSELTSSIALQICSDKALTQKVLQDNGLKVPRQMIVSTPEHNVEFLNKYRRIVVKPAQGEQGVGVSVDLSNPEEVELAVERARKVSETVLLEEFVAGRDLRVLVINNEVVAAAFRQPAQIKGNGVFTIRELIEKQSRRRQSATGGESSIPLDEETLRCIQAAGYTLDSIIGVGERLNVRKTANLHTGGTIHDVTDQLHPELAQACLQAAQALQIPVVGIDLIIVDDQKLKYKIIEANERPGLANHEPHPTAERFIDLLFPQTKVQNKLEYL